MIFCPYTVTVVPVDSTVVAITLVLLIVVDVDVEDWKDGPTVKDSTLVIADVTPLSLQIPFVNVYPFLHVHPLA